jgi:hypothetical protein
MISFYQRDSIRCNLFRKPRKQREIQTLKYELIERRKERIYKIMKYTGEKNKKLLKILIKDY